MGTTIEDTRARWNATRFVIGSERGAYESWFQRANHPSRPLAFWIRYTIFSPRGRARDAVGELWAVWFDGEKREIVAVKEEHPISACRFSGQGLDATIAKARLDAAGLQGAASRGAHAISWSLAYASSSAPLLLLPCTCTRVPCRRPRRSSARRSRAMTGTSSWTGRKS